MKRIVATALLLLVTVTGCMAKSPGSEPGPVHKWFNPHGQPVEDVVPDKCSPAEMPPPADVPPKIPGDAIPAGWRHATYTLSMDSMKITDPLAWKKDAPNLDLEYCIPVSMYAYITAAGMPATMVEVTEDGVSQHPLPWNGLRNTPWRSTIVVAWDPKTTAPVMNFEFSGKYEVGSGLSKAPTPIDAKVALMCRIRQEAITFGMGISLDIHASPAQISKRAVAEYVEGPLVRCNPAPFSARPQ